MIDNLNGIFKGIRTHRYKLEVLEQSNAVLTSYKSSVIVQLPQMNLTINDMQAQLKTFFLRKLIQKEPRVSSTFGTVEAILLVVVKPSRRRKLSQRGGLLQEMTKGGAKRGKNDGWGR